MSNVIEYAPFYLKKEVSIPDFMLASDRLQSEFLSKQKGYVSRKLLAKGEVWCDLIFWETMDDAQSALKAFYENAAACAYLSFLEEENEDCEILHFSVQKSYE